MTLCELKQIYIDSLSSQYDIEHLHSIFYDVVEHLLGYNRVEATLSEKIVLSNKKINQFNEFLARLELSEPIHYVLNRAYFASCYFELNQSVLIPRPETEEMVYWIADHQKVSQSLLDIGTGSGCIAISLSKIFPKNAIVGWDISKEAIQVANNNNSLNKTCVKFEQKNILKTVRSTQKWDIIVSNPPYVKVSEQKKMHPNVLKYEPHNALFVSDRDPLIFYKSISKFGLSFLKKGGMLFFEINASEQKNVQKLLVDLGYSDIVVRNDFRGLPRFVKAVYQ